MPHELVERKVSLFDILGLLPQRIAVDLARQEMAVWLSCAYHVYRAETGSRAAILWQDKVTNNTIYQGKRPSLRNIVCQPSPDANNHPLEVLRHVLYLHSRPCEADI